MGRFYSAQGNSSSANSIKPWNNLYSERPVWGIWTLNSSGAAAWVYAYGEQNRTMSVGNDRLDSTNSRMASTITGSGTEAATAYYVTGNSATQMSSQTWAPASGYYGINSNSQTALLNNAYAFQNGNIGFMSTTTQSWIQRWAATQVLSPTEQQHFDFVGHNSTGYKIQVAQVEALQADLDYTYTAGTLNTGSLFDTTNHLSGIHNMSYNRRTNTMAFIFHCADSATGTKRVHLFKMNSNFVPNQFTTGTAVVNALIDAKAAGGYSTYLVSLPSWHSNTSSAGRYGCKFILCDDNSFWYVAEPYNNGGSSNMGLWSAVLSNGSYTATQVKSIANTTHYNSDAGDQYSLHHQNSDDGKYIAVYSHYYYYMGGYSVYMLGTATAALVNGLYDYSWYSDSGSQSVTIAPSGGSEFVTCDGYQNADGGAGPYIRFHSPNQKSTSTYNALRRAMPIGVYPSYSMSTNYQGCFVFKYQPVNQYK